MAGIAPDGSAEPTSSAVLLNRAKIPTCRDACKVYEQTSNVGGYQSLASRPVFSFLLIRMSAFGTEQTTYLS